MAKQFVRGSKFIVHADARIARYLDVKGQQGFAYLWTLMLVAFMGVGLVIASELYSTALQREKERDLLFIGHEFRNAIGRYYESKVVGGQNQYPMTLEELLKDSRFPNGRRYLRRIYTDPMTGKNAWGVILVKGRIAGIHSLSEKKPIKQDNFEIGEADFRMKEKYSEWVFTYPSDLLLTAPVNAGGADSTVDNGLSIKPKLPTTESPNKETSSTTKNSQ